MNPNYQLAISRLELIIENWFDKEELKKHLITSHYGLCFNIGFNAGIAIPLHDCIKEYLHTQNISETSTNMFFPVEQNYDTYHRHSDSNKLYNNPRRLHLAVYMLAWFRYHALD